MAERKETPMSDKSKQTDLRLDGGWGWIVTLAAFVGIVISDGISCSFGVLLPVLTQQFGESKRRVSFVGSLQIGVYFCSALIASCLLNRFGCRPVTMVGSVVASIGFMLASYATNLNILLLTYGLLGGIGFGMIYLPSIVAVGYYFEKKRSLATGIALCGSGIGTFVFSPLNNYLIKEYDWRYLMFIQAGIILHGVVCGMIMRPFHSENSRKRSSRNISEKIDPDPMNDQYMSVPSLDKNIYNLANTNRSISLTDVYFRSKPKNEYKNEEIFCNRDYLHPLLNDITILNKVKSKSLELETIPSKTSSTCMFNYVNTDQINRFNCSTGINEVRQFDSKVEDKTLCLPECLYGIVKNVRCIWTKAFVMLFMGNLFAFIGFFIPIIYIVDRAILELHVSTTKAAFLPSVIGITNTIGRVLCGFLADLHFVNPLVFATVMLFIGAVALFLEPLCTTFATMILFSVVYGLCIAATVSLTSPIVCNLLGIDKLPIAYSLLEFARGLAGIAGPPLAGAIFQKTQNYDASFYFGAGMFLLGALCYLFVSLPCIKNKEKSAEISIETDFHNQSK